MIDIQAETVIALTQASKLIPPGRSGRPVHPSFFVRAIKSRELEGIRSGSRWLTSMEAVQRWLDRQTAAAIGRPVAAGIREDAAVSRELDAAGIF